MFLKKLLLSLLVLSLLGCSATSNTINKETKKPGRFAITKVGEEADFKLASVSNFFDMGNIKGSQRYFFQIINVGDSDITSISITADNDKFTAKPSALGILKPLGTGEVGSLLAINVEHGERIDGSGSIPPLPSGLNSSNFLVSGYANGHLVTFNFTIQVNALLFDYRLTVSPDITLGTSFIFSSPVTALGGLRRFGIYKL